MKTILTGILSLLIFFGSVPTAQASEMNMAGMEEIKKKKKKNKDKKSKAGKGKKGGWVYCNAPDGKGGYKSCGRGSGEKRKKYPACRPTMAQCTSAMKKKTSSKGISWK